MSSRHPPESPDDDKQSELLQEGHNALNDITPVNDHAEEQPAAENERDAPRLVKEDDAKAELDRMEAYLRGPTAFTA